ncbi:hypothetical protein [Geoglobus ahangari]
MHWNVPLSKEDFEMAKAGKLVVRGGFINKRGVLAFLILSNQKLTRQQIKEKFHGILANGHDVYYVDVSEWDWEQLDRPELNKVPYIEFSDGVGFLFISEGAARRLKEEADA